MRAKGVTTHLPSFTMRPRLMYLKRRHRTRGRTGAHAGIVALLLLATACSRSPTSTAPGSLPAADASIAPISAEQVSTPTEVHKCNEGEPVVSGIRQALGFGDLLWIVTADGGLRSVDLAAARIESPLAGTHVTAIHRSKGGALWIATTDAAHRLTVRERKGGSIWVPILQTTTSDQDAWLAELEGAPVVVTTSALFRLQSGVLRRVGLSEKLDACLGPRPSTAVAGRSLYLGVDRGEWGGGVRRIGLDDGAVTSITKKDTPGLCVGPLDPACDPVTAVTFDIPSPERGTGMHPRGGGPPAHGRRGSRPPSVRRRRHDGERVGHPRCGSD